ncbi:flavodoxin [Tenacibaculum piscium]|uniref:Flavodoxin n=1 Tax=Tenacibaculum piscium TaxID=1458515 RepID=A0A2H1YK97_9FLAO|nr:flavodoxin [Tenacibaculum piscium]MBE7629376.1 flavodoxin [Tenacibaculum piscium]MBE7670163.1 flavodoxin [Tenacibaculum piscium]MBE7685412.1 flavodoxin [Tenacibaculum piscium]MBE7689997.1 flavodoxin [Tenacibaculum piscium]SOS75830.1 Flavodoxin [Tenacibaculum piscium]
MKTIGLIYGSDTGMTEEITNSIVDQWSYSDIKVIEVSEAKKSDFEQFDVLILGLSTWYDGDLQSDWEAYFDEFKTINFTNKTVAIYGLGDQYGYGEYFIDGVGMLAEVILKNGGNITGFWPVKGYDFTASKALYNNDYFYGLALDEDNQPEYTQQRITDWLSILEDQFSILLN